MLDLGAVPAMLALLPGEEMDMRVIVHLVLDGRAHQLSGRGLLGADGAWRGQGGKQKAGIARACVGKQR